MPFNPDGLFMCIIDKIKSRQFIQKMTSQKFKLKTELIQRQITYEWINCSSQIINQRVAESIIFQHHAAGQKITTMIKLMALFATKSSTKSVAKITSGHRDWAFNYFWLVVPLNLRAELFSLKATELISTNLAWDIGLKSASIKSHHL